MRLNNSSSAIKTGEHPGGTDIIRSAYPINPLVAAKLGLLAKPELLIALSNNSASFLLNYGIDSCC